MTWASLYPEPITEEPEAVRWRSRTHGGMQSHLTISSSAKAKELQTYKTDEFFKSSSPLVKTTETTTGPKGLHTTTKGARTTEVYQCF